MFLLMENFLFPKPKGLDMMVLSFLSTTQGIVGFEKCGVASPQKEKSGSFPIIWRPACVQLSSAKLPN